MPLIPPPPIWTPILELRARLERRIDRDFSDATDDSTYDLLSRFRGGVRYAKGRLSGQAVFQYAHGRTGTRLRTSQLGGATSSSRSSRRS